MKNQIKLLILALLFVTACKQKDSVKYPLPSDVVYDTIINWNGVEHDTIIDTMPKVIIDTTQRIGDTLKSGFSALLFYPWNKVSVNTTIKALQEKYPNQMSCFRFPAGEGSQNYDFYNTKNRAYTDSVVLLCQRTGATAIIVLDGYRELTNDGSAAGNAAAQVARKSNLAVARYFQGKGVKCVFELSNEMYSKPEFTGWKPPYTVETEKSKASMAAAVTKYIQWAKDTKQMIGVGEVYAYNWATDMNKAHKFWNDRIIANKAEVQVVAAHIYPDPYTTGTALRTLVTKRIGRAINAGFEVMNLESNTYFDFKGDPEWLDYSLSLTHMNRLKEMKQLMKEFGVTYYCWHMLGRMKEDNQPYSFIRW